MEMLHYSLSNSEVSLLILSRLNAEVCMAFEGRTCSILLPYLMVCERFLLLRVGMI